MYCQLSGHVDITLANIVCCGISIDLIASVLFWFFSEDGEKREDDTQYRMDINGMIEKIFLITLENGKRKSKHKQDI